VNRISSFIYRKWAWACQKKLFWANIALVSITIAVVFVWPGPVVSGTPSDFRVRAWGMVLQLLGVYTVWRDLTGTAREFGEESIMGGTWTWLKQGFNPKTIILCASGCASAGSVGSARATVRAGIDSNASVDGRIAALERYVQQIDADVAGAFSEIRLTENKISEKFDQKSSVLERSIRATETRLRSAVIGNYPVLLFGAVWLAFGIILSSIAPEIAKVVAHQYQATWIGI
jgi:hypothetical protein